MTVRGFTDARHRIVLLSGAAWIVIKQNAPLMGEIASRLSDWRYNYKRQQAWGISLANNCRYNERL